MCGQSEQILKQEGVQKIAKLLDGCSRNPARERASEYACVIIWYDYWDLVYNFLLAPNNNNNIRLHGIQPSEKYLD